MEEIKPFLRASAVDRACIPHTFVRVGRKEKAIALNILHLYAQTPKRSFIYPVG